RRFQEIAQQLTGSLQQFGGQNANGGFQQSGSSQQSGSVQQSGSFQQCGSQYQSAGSQGFQSGRAAGSGIDALAVAECLKDCKCMSVNAMRAATEAAQPIRNTLYQVAGEHLRYAEQHYHWLEQ